MNKLLLAITSMLFIAGSSANAAPELGATEGLLGSPAVQAPAQDPVLQKAIEWIQSKQTNTEIKKNSNPHNTIGEKAAPQRRLIMGGPEMLPM